MRFIGLAIISAKMIHPPAMAVTYQIAVTPMLYPLEVVPITALPPIQPAIQSAPSLKAPIVRPPT